MGEMLYIESNMPCGNDHFIHENCFNRDGFCHVQNTEHQHVTSIRGEYTHGSYFLSLTAGSHRAVRVLPGPPHVLPLQPDASLVLALCENTFVTAQGCKSITDTAFQCFQCLFNGTMVKTSHVLISGSFYQCDGCAVKQQGAALS